MTLHENCEFYVLRPTDIGSPVIDAFGRKLLVHKFMSFIKPSDVGKRIYLVNGVPEVESDAQRKHRWQRDLMQPFQVHEPESKVIPFRRR